MSTVDLTRRDEAEIQRSAIHASRYTNSLMASTEQVSRYANPSSCTPYFLEYCFHLLGDVRGKVLLDFGCGAGENSLLLASRGAEVTGIDISPELVQIANERLAVNHQRADFRVVSVYDTALAAASVDVVFCMAILHHLEADRAQKEILRILKPGGLLIVQEPVRDSRVYSFFRRLIPYSMHDNSEFEHPLTVQEMDSFSSPFRCEAKRRFRLPFVALAAMSGLPTRFVWRLDRWVLTRMPVLGKLATIEVRKLRRV